MGHLGLFWLAGVVVLAFLDPPLKMTWQEICVARNIMTSRTTRTTEDGGLLLAGGCGFGAPACFSGRRSGGLVLALADVGWWQCCILPSLKVLHVRHSGEHRLRYPDLIGCTFLREPPCGVVFGSASYRFRSAPALCFCRRLRGLSVGRFWARTEHVLNQEVPFALAMVFWKFLKLLSFF